MATTSSTRSTGPSTAPSDGSCSVRTARARRRCCRSPRPSSIRPAARPPSSTPRSARADVFELRPRIGFASTAMAKRIPASETVLDVVLTAAYSVTGRWNEQYDDLDVRRAQRVLAEWKLGHLGRPPLRPAQRRRAEARPDRPRRDDRPRAPAARRAGREPRPRCPRGAAPAARRLRELAVRARDHHGHPPRGGDPARIHPRAAAQRWRRRALPARSTRSSPPRSCPRPSASASRSSTRVAASPPAPATLDGRRTANCRTRPVRSRPA